MDTSLGVILDISNTTAQFRAILTTELEPEEVTVDKRWCVMVKSTQLYHRDGCVFNYCRDFVVPSIRGTQGSEQPAL